MTERNFDIICMGRAAVDFYGDQIGSRLEDMTSFSKYLGGSAAKPPAKHFWSMVPIARPSTLMRRPKPL